MIIIALMYSMLQRVLAAEYHTGVRAETAQAAFGVKKELPRQNVRKLMPRRWVACAVSARPPVCFR